MKSFKEYLSEELKEFKVDATLDGKKFPITVKAKQEKDVDAIVRRVYSNSGYKDIKIHSVKLNKPANKPFAKAVQNIPIDRMNLEQAKKALKDLETLSYERERGNDRYALSGEMDKHDKKKRMLQNRIKELSTKG